MRPGNRPHASHDTPGLRCTNVKVHSDPLTIVLSNPGVSRLSEAQIARISPVGIGHANEAEAGVPYYDDTFDEDDECTTADISDPDGCAPGVRVRVRPLRG